MKNLLVALAFVVAGTTAVAQEQTQGIMVTGKGIVNVTPDEVLIKVRVEHESDTAENVKSKTDKGVDAVLTFLKKQGIDSKDIKTEYIRLDKIYQYNTKTYRYTANQAISILLKDIDDYEETISGLIESGINRIDGIQFQSSTIETHKSEARIKAIKNAKEKAGEYAKALEQTVGKAYLVSELKSTGVQPVYKTMRLEAAADSSQGNQDTLAEGEMEVEVNVQVNFHLHE